MEYILASRIRTVCSLGIPVETWMVRADAREILHELYPSEFPDPSETAYGHHPFKASNTWLKRFFFIGTVLVFGKLDHA